MSTSPISTGWWRTLLAGLVLALLALGLSARSAIAQEAGEARAVVAARDLPRGAVLAREDIEFVPADGAETPGVSDPVGWVTRRVVSAGEPLREPAITPPNLVASGQVVQLVYRSGPVELRLVGRALGSAARGERVQVRIDAKRRLSGVVVDQGLVRMDAQENASR